MNTTDNRQIAALVSRMLSHYWTAADPPETRQAQIEDWIGDLRRYSIESVIDACSAWRIRETKRPTPADIIALAMVFERERREEIEDQRPEAQAYREAVVRSNAERLKRAERRNVEMQREGRELVNAWAKAQGHASIDDYAIARQMDWSDAYRTCMHDILSGSPLAKGVQMALRRP